MIHIWTDGSADVRTRFGGAAAVLQYRPRAGRAYEREIAESYRDTTNNRMELQAVILGLNVLRRRDLPVTIHSDSMYVIGGCTTWHVAWRERRWKGVANRDLWEALLSLLPGLDIYYEHVRGHTGEAGNERCHALAYAAMRSA